MNNPKRILLVDDDPNIREMIAAFLTLTEFEITQAVDVGSAMDELTAGKSFDLVILDFWLGTDHAVSIMDLVASKAHDIPIIMMSGGNGSMDLEKTEAISDVSGAVVFLQKPFHKSDLMAAVTSALN